MLPSLSNNVSTVYRIEKLSFNHLTLQVYFIPKMWIGGIRNVQYFPQIGFMLFASRQGFVVLFWRLRLALYMDILWPKTCIRLGCSVFSTIYTSTDSESLRRPKDKIHYQTLRKLDCQWNSHSHAKLCLKHNTVTNTLTDLTRGDDNKSNSISRALCHWYNHS